VLFPCSHLLQCNVFGVVCQEGTEPFQDGYGEEREGICQEGKVCPKILEERGASWTFF
jgi:hypothetical protein